MAFYAGGNYPKTVLSLSIPDFYRDVGQDSKHVIVSVALYHNDGAKKHEYTVFTIKSTAKLEAPAHTFYVRLDRTGAILKEDSSGRASANASLVSSSTFNATHEVRITRQLEDNPKFSGANDVLRCRATFTKHQPFVGVLVYVLEQMQTLGSLKEYTLFWDNCWAFARTLFRKFALDEAYPTMVEIRNTDGNMASTNAEALDAYLGRLMYEDVFIAVGGVVGGVTVGTALGGMALGSAAGDAALTIAVASGPVGIVAAMGVFTLGLMGAAMGGALLGVRSGSFVHANVWEAEFTAKWRKVCDRIRLPHGALWHVA